jgi:hypothetical protein
MRRITGLKNLSSAAPASAVALVSRSGSRAGQQHRAHRSVGGQLLPALLQLADHLARHGVELIGRVQRHGGQPIGLAEKDRLVSHAPLPFLIVP